MVGLRQLVSGPPPLRAILLGVGALLVWGAPACCAADALPEVKAFVVKHCAACHNDQDQKADLSLTGYPDGAAMLRGRKVWDNVLDMVGAGEMPPQDRPRPTADELAAFARNVKAVLQEASAKAKPDPGRVTVRRLNRFEYNRTIRDLVGIDFDAAEDFPSDDIGHGFDNIGDVLTLSPVLMERYLAAAETIMNRAIAVKPSAPPKRALASRWLEPAGAEAPQSRFRPITPAKSGQPIFSGPLHTSYPNLPAGEYIFRTPVYFSVESPTDPEGGAEKIESPRTVQVVLLACGRDLADADPESVIETIAGDAAKGLYPYKIVGTFDVAATASEKPQRLEAKFMLPPGTNRLAVGLRKLPEGSPPLTLHVESFELEGPLDTRPPSHHHLLAADGATTDAERTQFVLKRFASRAYRRPATTNEVERLAKLVEVTQAEGQSWEAAVQRAMQAVLVSPKFLFRLELDDRAPSAEPRPLDDYQLAARLSYFLWGTMPDDELFALAENQQLTAQLPAQVERMLKDPRSEALFDSFAMQWLQLQRLRAFSPDKELFPEYDPQLQEDMLRETRELFVHVVREDRPLTELIDCNYTFLNERLARHYGVVDTAGNLAGQQGVKSGQPIRGDPFVRVDLQDGSRGGLLTMASVLTVTSNPTRTSPVKRGKWVLEQILGAPPPPPPPNVPELVEQKTGMLTGTLRQRMEQHRANPACANCHAKMDPLGFAFENYNAIGRWRSEEDKFPVDPSGELPGGRKFSGPGELKGIILQNKESFVRCLTEKLLTYALGRGLEYYDQPTVDRIVAEVAKHDYRFSRLALEIARSDPFRLQRGSEVQP